METQVVENAKMLIENLQKEFMKINEEVEKKDNQILNKSEEIKELKDLYEKTYEEHEKQLIEKDKIAEVVKSCHIDVCEYKIVFNEIVANYTESFKNSGKNFHFFVCFRSDYSKDGQTIMEAHEDVIDKEGFSWWGKFYRKLNSQGNYIKLEPFGESINTDNYNAVVDSISRKVKDRIKNGEKVYLYTYNPNPPNLILYVSNIIDIFIGYDGEMLPSGENDKPCCAYFPDYYFRKREGNCIKCKKRDEDNCKFEFKSNFFFKIDKIQELGSWRKHGSITNEFKNLKNIYTNDAINFAVPIFYPLLVYQEIERNHFLDNVKLNRGKWDGHFKPVDGEAAHTNVKKVSTFFSNLHKECGNTFNDVLQLQLCNPKKGSKPKVLHTQKNDEIEIFLPAEYRQEGAGSKFRILLNEDTSLDQKRKIIELINGHITKEYI